jgi:hypothetical protein
MRRRNRVNHDPPRVTIGNVHTQCRERMYVRTSVSTGPTDPSNTVPESSTPISEYSNSGESRNVLYIYMY